MIDHRSTVHGKTFCSPADTSCPAAVSMSEHRHNRPVQLGYTPRLPSHTDSWTMGTPPRPPRRLKTHGTMLTDAFDSSRICVCSSVEWMGHRLQAGKQSRYVTSHPGQLSLAILSWVGAMNTSESRNVSRHTARCTISISVVRQC